jgi:O-antigen/teichoic acid export membrane protein
LRVGRFGRSVAVLAGGTAVAQAVTIALSPIITRLYGPDDFGVLSAYIAISSIVVVVASLRYELAIPLPRREEEAANLLALSGLLSLTTACALACGLWLDPPFLQKVEAYRAIRSSAYWLPLSVLGGSLYQSLNYWAVRRRAFTRIARTRMAQALALSTLQLLFGGLRLRPVGLLAADAAGRSTGTGSLALLALREDRAWQYVSLRGMWDAMRIHKRFAIFASPASALNTMALNLAPLLLTDAYGVRVAGEFALAQRILSLPVALLGDAVSQVYLVDAARLARDDPRALDRLLVRTAVRLAALAAIPSVILLVFGPRLFVIAFGAPWADAGHYAQLLAAMVVLQLAISPLSQTLNVLRLQHWQLAWDAGRTLAVAGVVLLCASRGASPRMAIGAYAATMSGAYAVNLLLLRGAARRAGADA